MHNGIRLAQFNRPLDTALRAITQDRDRPIVFTSARLYTRKGHMRLLEAAALVPDALFILAGDGPERAALERHAKLLGVEARSAFLANARTFLNSSPVATYSCFLRFMKDCLFRYSKRWQQASR